MPRRKPSVISLFTGAGGLDCGLEAAGFQTRVAVEMDADAVATIKANADWPALDRDIHDIPTKELLRAAELKVGEADLLVGGPPCQPFSKSGYWARGDALRLDDPRASTLEAYLRVLRDAKPRAFLLENVPGLAYRNKDEGLHLLQKTVGAINRAAGTSYSFSVAVLNAADYGVPQERERAFVIGHREGAAFGFPPPTHRRPRRTHLGDVDERQSSLPIEGGELAAWTTTWDAIGDLEDDDDPSLKVGGKWSRLLPSIPEGCNYLYHTDRGGGRPLFGWRRRYWSFLLKLAKALPAWTITAQPGSAIGPFHWKNRRLSMAELCRLQTFPDGFHVTGSRTAVQRQLGNAVPSALAELLGIEILAQLLLPSRRRSRRLSLLPKCNGAPPPAEPVRPVPREYLHLIGEHEPHPGTGMGYAAQARAAQTSRS